MLPRMVQNSKQDQVKPTSSHPTSVGADSQAKGGGIDRQLEEELGHVQHDLRLAAVSRAELTIIRADARHALALVVEHHAQEQRLAGAEETQVEREPLRNIAEQHALDHAELGPELRRVGECVGHKTDPSEARGDAEEDPVVRQHVEIEAIREREPAECGRLACVCLVGAGRSSREVSPYHWNRHAASSGAECRRVWRGVLPRVREVVNSRQSSNSDSRRVVTYAASPTMAGISSIGTGTTNR
eukprot:scaffold69400_cov66-Phaeocystis_antarctica.AAC.2